MTKRKILALFVLYFSVVIMLCSQDGFEFSDGVILGYSGSSERIVIPSRINNIPVTSIGEGAFQQKTYITSVDLPDSIKTIGDGAFYACTSLQFVTMGENIEKIGDVAFGFCSQLERIEIPETVKSIGNAAFKKCTSLIYINIPDSVEIIDNGAFYFCSSLMEINIGSGIKRIGNGAFGYCYRLGYINIHSMTPPTLGPFLVDAFTVDTLKIQVPEEAVSIYKSTIVEGWGSIYKEIVCSIP